MTPGSGKALTLLAHGLLAHRANRRLRRWLAREPGAAARLSRQVTVLLIRLACLEYGLQPWGGFLWSPASLPELDGCVLDDPVRRAVALLLPAGPSALAEWYEALLTLSARLDLRARTLHLEPARGSSRKRWGSYSTPPGLIAPLLESALDPILNAVDNPLALKVCDPACGSGGLLLAAARRLAAKLDKVSNHGDSFAQVVRHCLHGVDRDPLAVELCKLRLACECGADVGSLDGQIHCGNSLVGSPPDI